MRKFLSELAKFILEFNKIVRDCITSKVLLPLPDSYSRVIPSFAIPIARGMGGYATTGWANLLFGGLCAGFVTGAFWRPRRPTVLFEDGEKSSIDIGRD